MFICSDCRRLYDGVPVTVSEGPCEVCEAASPCGDFRRYTRKTDKELSCTINSGIAEIERLRGLIAQERIECAALARSMSEFNPDEIADAILRRPVVTY